MTFDWTINVGGVIALASLIVTLFTLHASNIRRIAKMEEKIDVMYTWWKRQI